MSAFLTKPSAGKAFSNEIRAIAQKNRHIIDDENFEFEEPELPEAYNPEILPHMGDVQRKTMEAEWEKHKQHYPHCGSCRFTIPVQKAQQIHGLLPTHHQNPHRPHPHRHIRGRRPWFPWRGWRFRPCRGPGTSAAGRDP